MSQGKMRRVVHVKSVTAGQYKGLTWLLLDCGHQKYVTVYRNGSKALCKACLR